MIMPVYKDEKRGIWYFKCNYRDWQGEIKTKMKRGFATKKEAQKLGYAEKDPTDDIAGYDALFLGFAAVGHLGYIDASGQFIVAQVHIGNDGAGDAQMVLQLPNFLMDGFCSLGYILRPGEGNLG